MKLSELKPCDLCNGPVVPMIYKVKLERHFIKADKTNCQLGMAQLMGGSVQLSSIMGTNEDVTQEIDSFEMTLCQTCFLEERMGRLMGDE